MTRGRATNPLAMALATILAAVNVKGQGQLGLVKCHIAKVCDLQPQAFPLKVDLNL